MCCGGQGFWCHPCRFRSPLLGFSFWASSSICVSRKYGLILGHFFKCLPNGFGWLRQRTRTRGTCIKCWGSFSGMCERVYEEAPLRPKLALREPTAQAKAWAKDVQAREQAMARRNLTHCHNCGYPESKCGSELTMGPRITRPRYAVHMHKNI